MKLDDQISAVAGEEFLVGGVRMPRPFRIRRLGHFGINVADPEASLNFYARLLGFRISDPIDFRPRLPSLLRRVSSADSLPTVASTPCGRSDCT